MRIRLQLLANQNWRSNGCYQSLACAPGSGYENVRNTATTKTVVIFWTQNRVFQDIEANETKEITIDCGHKPFLVIALYIRRHIHVILVS